MLTSAAAIGGDDFEDNLQIVSASAAGLDLIVTRDLVGFGHSCLHAVVPAELIARLANPE